jgi:methionyl-tRNA formyltransferase
VIQPQRIRNNPEFVAQLRHWAPDVIVVVAYGKILPPEILALPPHGCINVHASLLPRYRGAAPIQWALIRGETRTGISVMLMTEEMDAGPVLLQCPLAIEPGETYGELERRLAELGAACLLRALRGWRAGTIQAQPPDITQVTFAPPITKDMGQIDWSRSAEEIARWVHGLSPNPGAYFTWEGKRVKVYRARAHAKSESSSLGPAGTVVSVEPALMVACGSGVLELVEVQLEGRRRASGSEVARGLRWRPGQQLAGTET